jgi:hypothetical protein
MSAAFYECLRTERCFSQVLKAAETSSRDRVPESGAMPVPLSLVRISGNLTLQVGKKLSTSLSHFLSNDKS